MTPKYVFFSKNEHGIQCHIDFNYVWLKGKGVGRKTHTTQTERQIHKHMYSKC